MNHYTIYGMGQDCPNPINGKPLQIKLHCEEIDIETTTLISEEIKEEIKDNTKRFLAGDFLSVQLTPAI